MSETYFLISNGSRALAVSLAQILDAQKQNTDFDVEDQEQLKVCAMTLAGDRFQSARQPHEDLKVHEVIELVDGSPVKGNLDGPADIGVTDAVLIEAARHLYGSDDFEIDDDAVISGMNVQGWCYVSASSALEALASMDPVRVRRESPARGAKVEQNLETLKGQTRSLLNLVAALTSSGAQPSPADIDALGQQAKIVEQLLGTRGEREQIVHATAIQTWEAGEGSSEGFSEDQLKRWNVTLSQSGDQLRLCVWPEGEDVEEAKSGLGVVVEINKGYPALHISPSPNADNSCHVHPISTHEVEIAPGTHLGCTPVKSRVYENERAVVFSNGTPL